MKAKILQVDAFTTRRFAGNPAAIVPLQSFPDDAVMQAIAAENNLAETAFLVPADGDYKIRWFSPTIEIPLCGHATLASAAVIMERLEPARTSVTFHSASGPLSVARAKDGYVMNFPALESRRVKASRELVEALGAVPRDVRADAINYMVLLDSASVLRALTPDMARVARLDREGVIVTAPGDEEYDFVSRYFAPARGIPEDPVTGSAHCMLMPYWAEKLGRTELRAFQASPRGGEMICRLAGDRVEMEGSCIFYLEGEIEF